jgi:hypothetical protein
MVSPRSVAAVPVKVSISIPLTVPASASDTPATLRELNTVVPAPAVTVVPEKSMLAPFQVKVPEAGSVTARDGAILKSLAVSAAIPVKLVVLTMSTAPRLFS